MTLFRKISGALVVTLCLSATAGQAQDIPARCVLLGQVSTSTFLSLARALSLGSDSGVDRSTARLADLVGLYDSLGCDTARLSAVFDCVLGETNGTDGRSIAQGCLAQAELLRP